MIEAKYNSMISVRHGKCRMRSGKVLDSDANLLSTYVGSRFKVQGFFICHIIVIQGITRSEMQSNQVRSVDSAKQ